MSLREIKQKQLPQKAKQMLAHFIRFNKEMNFDFSAPIVVACSGGLDSIALTHLLLMAGANVRLIHVDHGTRQEIRAERHLVRNFAHKYQIPMKSLKVELSLNDGNFEAQARKLRYDILKNDLENDELLVTGHHLDDCFEWSLLQQFKSQGKDIDLGIPYRNGRVYRPLFAFSKKHILKYAKLAKLTWLEDYSNEDIRFERNHIRKIVKESISSRWPGYLKHYCERMNRMKKIKQGLEDKNYKIIKRKWGILIKHHGCVDENLKKTILSQASTTRGKTYKQFNELEGLINSPRLGPLDFSGGIRVYAFGPYLAVVKKGCKLEFLNNKTTQIPEGVPFLSNNTNAKHSLKKTPLENSTLRKIFSEIKQPVHYSWRKAGKVLVWL